MVYEKQPTANGRPALKPNAPRLAGRGAIPPKLASSSASNTPIPLRKDVSNKGISSPPGQTKEDVSTPVKAFLSSNITPRSGSRRARVDSASTTPNHTPNGTPKAARPVSMVERWDDGVLGRANEGSALGISGLDEGQPLRAQSVVSEGGRASKPYSRPSSSQSRPRNTNVTSPEILPKFFHADEAKPRLSAKQEPQRPPLQTVFSGYTQNGGDDNESNKSSLSTSTVPSEERPKFFRANSSAEAVAHPHPARPASRPPGHLPPFQSKSNGQPQNDQRAVSPLKDEIKPKASPFQEASNSNPLSRRSSITKPVPKDDTPSHRSFSGKPSPRRHTRLVSASDSTTTQGIQSPTATAPPIASSTRTTADLSRRSSLNLPSPRKASHVRASSVSGVNYPPSRRSSIALSDNIPKLSPLAASRPSASDSIPQSPPQNPGSTVSQPQATPPLSPSRPPQPPAQSKLDHLNELAAKARRERKVLDLEISNSSLLAINRTLEREMRKQKEELRKLRRASRRTADGRVCSMGTNRTVSSRMSGLSELTGAENDIDLEAYGDLSSEAEEDMLSDPYNDDETRSLSSSQSSPPPAGSSFAKDTKRLNLDFSRHRHLLVESQRLNQSMKRCLDTTESLILDGKKALDYQVDVSEIESIPLSPLKTGGRVLEPSDEDDAFGERGQGLLSPAAISSNNPWDLHLDNFHTTEEPPPEEPDLDQEWDIDGIGTALTSPLASPSPVAPPSSHPPVSSPDSDHSPPKSSAALKTGWDAIKQDVKTPDGLRAAAPLGLGNYLQSLGWSPG
ncbi:MAG: hypothetical protein Q9195_003039 [Heterodermia aff. obscurata]